MRRLNMCGAIILLFLVTRTVAAQDNCSIRTITVMGDGTYNLSTVYSVAKPHLNMTEVQFKKYVSDCNEGETTLSFGKILKVPVGVRAVLDRHGYLRRESAQTITTIKAPEEPSPTVNEAEKEPPIVEQIQEQEVEEIARTTQGTINQSLPTPFQGADTTTVAQAPPAESRGTAEEIEKLEPEEDPSLVRFFKIMIWIFVGVIILIPIGIAIWRKRHSFTLPSFPILRSKREPEDKKEKEVPDSNKVYEKLRSDPKNADAIPSSQKNIDWDGDISVRAKTPKNEGGENVHQGENGAPVGYLQGNVPASPDVIDMRDPESRES